MTVAAGVLYLIAVVFGSYFIVRERSPHTISPADLLICRLIAGFALFFLAFDALGAIGLFVRGSWITFPNALGVAMAFAVAGYICVRRHPPLSVPAINEVVTSPVPAFNGTTRLVAAAVAAGFALVAALLIIGFPR